MWTPLFLAALIATAFVVKARRPPKGVMSDDRHQILDAALRKVEDPAKLRRLAEAFEKEGLTDAAGLLRKRAGVRELPKHVKNARKAAFQKVMECKNPIAVRKMADMFENEACLGAADALREYAKGLDVVAQAQKTAEPSSSEPKAA